MDRFKSKATLWSLLTLTIVVGCGGEGADEPAGPLRLATINAGLARGDIDFVDERAPVLVETLAALDIELLCVQELWQDYPALEAAAAARLPHTVRRDASADCAKAACGSDEIGPLGTCGAQHCADLVGDDLLACGLELCPAEVGALGGSCLTCVIESAPGGLDHMVQSCQSLDDEAGESYLYDCAYDTAILTNARIIDHESRPLDSTLIAATVDYARIDTPVGELDVFCTHLASDMSFTYEGPFGSWKGEQAQQIGQLLSFVEEKNDRARPAVILGDLNTGPAIGTANIAGQWAEHYQQLVDAGFDNPYSDQEDVECTLCPDNSFQPIDSDSVLVDHVLLRDAPSATQSTRLLTGTIHLQVDGSEVESSYSDHYGQVLQLSVE